jgi:hypothetical protein
VIVSETGEPEVNSPNCRQFTRLMARVRYENSTHLVLPGQTPIAAYCGGRSFAICAISSLGLRSTV